MMAYGLTTAEYLVEWAVLLLFTALLVICWAGWEAGKANH